ncbi:MAG: peptidoglycan editing factor PgeF [Candidatus Binatia bacterium]|nr:peptidoglycan editing factor PgeF [Candidatus Binatia bacterium]
MIPFAAAPLWLHVTGWERFPGLVHGFSRRLGDKEALLQPGWDGFVLRTVKQVHGDRVIPVSPTDGSTSRPEADGMMTTAQGILLGIATADCVPVLLVEPHRRVIAALHAGWRGTLKGICAQAIAQLTRVYNVTPHSLWVALGPAIGACCYEVGREVGEAFVRTWGGQSAQAWQPRGEKGFLDLRLINYLQCVEQGVPPPQIQSVGGCTFCDHTFASYRREGERAGRQLSIIGWR